MSDTENARARREAVETTSRASSSPNRQRLWAGMNRYLAAEADHAHRAAARGAAAKDTSAKDKGKGQEEAPDTRPDHA